jgi:hypothetical protein
MPTSPALTNYVASWLQERVNYSSAVADVTVPEKLHKARLQLSDAAK